MKKLTPVLMILAMALFAATYFSSCHCSNPPASPPAPPPGDATAGVQKAITIDGTTDADFALFNRGYGITEDTSISTGIIRRSPGLPSFGLANVLGHAGVPNHVDSWGPTWDHDWVTWRAMMPKYLDEWTRPSAAKR